MTTTRTIPFILLNLEKRKDRLEWFQLQYKQLIQQNCLQSISCVEILSAVDRPDNPGLGCLHSHLNAIRLAKEKSYPWVLVGEDDIEFPSDFDSRFAKFQSHLPATFDLCFGACSQFGGAFHPLNPYFIQFEPRSGWITGTHCMVYHSRAYDKLINLLEQELKEDDILFRSHIDTALSMKYDGSLLLTVPFLAYFYDSPSNVRQKCNDVQQLMESEAKAKKLTTTSCNTHRE